jgi:hypothetical protein
MKKKREVAKEAKAVARRTPFHVKNFHAGEQFFVIFAAFFLN